jgi:hypothetical protein
MNLPLVWAAALPSSLAVKQSVEQTLSSTSHFFGDILRTTTSTENSPKGNKSSDNGLLELPTPASNPNDKSPSDDWPGRLNALKKRLGKIVEEARVRWGLPFKGIAQDGVKVEMDGAGKINVTGPDPIRTEVEKVVLGDPALVQDLREIASSRPSVSPALGDEPFRIWID